MDIKNTSGKARSIKLTDGLSEEILTQIRNGSAKLVEKKTQFVSKFNVKPSIGEVIVTYDKQRKQIVSVTEHINTSNDELEKIPVEVTKLLKAFGKK